jgi:hypothetical protein
MYFPPEFPPGHVLKAEIAILTAMQDFKVEPPPAVKVMAGMDKFAEIAAELVRNREWDLEAARRGLGTFLNHLSYSACDSFFRGMTSMALSESKRIQDTITTSNLWIGYLSDLIAAEKQQKALRAKSKRQPKPKSRREIIAPLLRSKGFSIYDWAKEAKVAHATAMDYVNGKKNPYPSTLKKLADALNIPIEKLPK